MIQFFQNEFSNTWLNAANPIGFKNNTNANQWRIYNEEIKENFTFNEVGTFSSFINHKIDNDMEDESKENSDKILYSQENVSDYENEMIISSLESE